jgi:hypothetical protein
MSKVTSEYLYFGNNNTDDRTNQMVALSLDTDAP